MRRLPAAIAIGTVTLCAVVGATILATRSNASDTSTIRIEARQTQAIEVPAPEQGNLLGARFIASDDLLVDDTLVGLGGRDCEAVSFNDDGSGRFQCLITLALDDGVITVQALPQLSPNGLEPAVGAITGGTGRYLGATGRADIEQVSETETDIVLDLD